MQLRVFQLQNDIDIDYIYTDYISVTKSNETGNKNDEKITKD